MQIEELRTFVEIANAGGISAAAFRLGLPKSIVSRRLVRLEEELGVQLLSRSTRGAALTEAGQMFRDHALRACAEIDVAREATQSSKNLRGRLRIAAPISLSMTHVAPALTEMARLHPQLQIYTSYSDNIVDLTEEGFDCAVRLGPLQDTNLSVQKIGSVPLTIVASPSYIRACGTPKGIQDLLQREALTRGTECWQLIDEGKIVSVHPQGRYKADDSLALLAASLAGLGIACLPTCLIQEHLNSGALVPVMSRHVTPPGDIFVVRPLSQDLTRKTRVLTGLLVDQCTRFQLNRRSEKDDSVGSKEVLQAG
ncbi:LysR family transcriptional regulator [Massilia sp. KIM]|uniref:LysR family transcriptional regulator n=1 Tax=Massilia sp. KIM TaxID=1955422 RepID=UPI00098EA5BC|nr:LysR family transcriptional regulator [Massilia sp. KIM]OON62497.1 LysR family transcriptional regulator [Massilia sp. KIM]